MNTKPTKTSSQNNPSPSEKLNNSKPERPNRNTTYSNNKYVFHPSQKKTKGGKRKQQKHVAKQHLSFRKKINNSKPKKPNRSTTYSNNKYFFPKKNRRRKTKPTQTSSQNNTSPSEKKIIPNTFNKTKHDCSQ